jgi:hypothetical protein
MNKATVGLTRFLWPVAKTQQAFSLLNTLL